jgi:hypothetical protein
VPNLCKSFVIFCLCGVLPPRPAFGDFLTYSKPLPEFHYPLLAGERARPFPYLIPNELFPLDARPIFERTGQGIYISVGTERGFVGAGLSHATHLFLADSAPEAVIFNRISILLLKAAAGDAGKYRELKLNPSALISKIDSANLSGEEKSWLRTMARTDWWQALVQNMSASFFWAKRPDERHSIYSGGVFQKLTELASSNRIQADLVDFSSDQDMTALSRAIQLADLKISVLDLSNAWQSRNLGPVRTRKSIRELLTTFTPESLILITRPHMRQRRTRIPIGDCCWGYFAARPRELEKNGFWQNDPGLAELTRTSPAAANNEFVSHFRRDRLFLLPNCVALLIAKLKRQ